jgi:KUP system potassium uptake protein
MFVTFFDTCMVSLAAIFVWRIPPYYVFLPWLTIACLDGVYLSSALVKVPQGAWFTLTLAAVLASCFILWRFGKEQQWLAEAADRFPTSHYVKTLSDGQTILLDRRINTAHTSASGGSGGHFLGSIRGFGIFFDKAGETTPIVFSQFISKLVAKPDVTVFFHLRPLETPTVAPEDRYTVSRLAIPHCYRLIVRHGFNDEIVTPDLAALIFEQVRDSVIKSGVGASSSVSQTEDEQTPTTLTQEADHQDVQAAPLKRRIIQIATPDSDEKIGRASQSDPATNDLPGGDGGHFVAPPYPATPPPRFVFPSTASALSVLEEAYNHQVLYIIGKEQLTVRPGTKLARRLLLQTWLFLRDNTRTKVASLKVQMDRVFEVGFVKEF